MSAHEGADAIAGRQPGWLGTGDRQFQLQPPAGGHLAVQDCWEGLSKRARTFLESALRQRLHSSSGKTERREPKSHFL